MPLREEIQIISGKFVLYNVSQKIELARNNLLRVVAYIIQVHNCHHGNQHNLTLYLKRWTQINNFSQHTWVYVGV